MNTLYRDRKLSDGFPDIEQRGVAYHACSHGELPHYTREFMRCIERLIDVTVGPRTVLVAGCGPKPHAIRVLLEMGYDAVGFEPVQGLRRSAVEFLADEKRVSPGTAEAMPFPDRSKRIIFMTSVLEHVDSPQKSLAEAYRILQPGGVLFIYTTNRLKFRLSGYNGEYRVPFFNWFPAVVRESYVFKHLHYDPTLANYNPRPAFHWFSYPDLCRLGREVGFGQFYSLLDLADLDNRLVAGSRLRRFLLNKVRYNPWLRGLTLTQTGGSIFMLKRPE